MCCKHEIKIIPGQRAAHGLRILFIQCVQISGECRLHLSVCDAHKITIRDCFGCHRSLLNDTVLRHKLCSAFHIRIRLLCTGCMILHKPFHRVRVLLADLGAAGKELDGAVTEAEELRAKIEELSDANSGLRGQLEETRTALFDAKEFARYNTEEQEALPLVIDLRAALAGAEEKLAALVERLGGDRRYIYDTSLFEESNITAVLAAEKSGLSPDYINSLEETASRSFLFNLVGHTYTPHTMVPQYDVPVTFSAFAAQGQVIRELAEKSSCIVIGRCAEYILRDDPDCLKVFLGAKKEDRIKRVMEEGGMDEKTAEKTLRQIDRGRANYYRSYTGEEWGAMENHDLCINTSVTGLDGAVELIRDLVKATGRLN